MMVLKHLTEVPSSCVLEDAIYAAFVDATSLIGGRNVVEEFLAWLFLLSVFVFVFCFAFSSFCYVYLCSPPSSGFSARLRVLVDPFTMIWYATHV
jgi:hypothetical protein